MKLELHKTTVAVLISGLYCVSHNVEAIAIPESIWLNIAEKLEYFIENELWDFNVISFEEWVNTCLLILPKPMVDDDDIKYMKEHTLYWEETLGNMIYVISMDIENINKGASE